MYYTISGFIDGYAIHITCRSMAKAAKRWTDLIEHPGADLRWMDENGRLIASASPIGEPFR